MPESTDEKDLATYQRMERWAAVLFLVGVAAVSQKVAELKASRFVPPDWFDLVPLLVGIYGALFLRVVNFRGRFARHNIAISKGEKVKEEIGYFKSGLLGWLITLMPLLAGIVFCVGLWQSTTK